MSIPLVVALFLSGAAAEGVYNDAFWMRWGDGKAEVDTYRLKQDRYGEARDGVVVAIFVTEPWSARSLVKDDAALGRDRLPVLKVHTLSTFQTGIYDYHMTTSAFVNLQPLNALAAGGTIKVSFSSQEWCGQVFHEITDDGRSASEVVRSYFAGESATRALLREPGPVLVEDAILLWARGLAGPPLPMTTSTVRFQSSLQRARLLHKPVVHEDVKVSRMASGAEVVVAAGTFTAERYRVVTSDRTIDVVVERGGAGRVLKLETRSSGGSPEVALELVKSDRLPYWQLHSKADDTARAQLGLSPIPLLKD